MRLFQKKPAVARSAFLQNFYDNSIFAVIDGMDVASTMWGVYYDQLVEADPHFSEVERTRFYDEMTAARFELFALAWLNGNGKDSIALEQLAFTRDYLTARGRADLWD